MQLCFTDVLTGVKQFALDIYYAEFHSTRICEPFCRIFTYTIKHAVQEYTWR